MSNTQLNSDPTPLSNEALINYQRMRIADLENVLKEVLDKLTYFQRPSVREVDDLARRVITVLDSKLIPEQRMRTTDPKCEGGLDRRQQSV